MANITNNLIGRYPLKLNPHAIPPNNPLDIKNLVLQTDDSLVVRPKPNSSTEIAYNGLIYDLDFIGNITYAISTDRGVIELIRTKMNQYNGITLKRHKVTLNLLADNGDVVQIDIWVIPLFMDGILCNTIFAADSTNLQALLECRNPTQSEQNGPYYI